MTLFKSINSGANWSNYQITKDSSYGFAVAVDTSNDDVIYVGGYDENYEGVLYKTKDGGTYWTRIGKNVITGWVNKIEVDPAFTNRVYVGTYLGLFRSEDFGSAWKKMADFGVNDIKINPAFPNELYVGGSAGVYKSVNFGTNLTEFNTGLVVKSVNSLDMIPINKTLYAGTSGGGIYKNCQMDLYLLTLNTTTGGTTIPTPGIYAYSKAEKIEINARPLTHYSFSGWSGDVSSFANPVIITMNADKSLTANFIRNLYAPLNFTGTKTENRYLFRVEYINVLRWEKNPDNEDSIKYRIYLIEGSTRKLLAEVSATTFEYWHRNLEKDKEYTYALVALDETGRESAAVYTAVR